MPTDQGAQGAQDQPGAQTGGPGGGVAGAVPIGTPDPLQKYKWYILSGVGLALVIAAAFMLRAKPGQASLLVAAEPSPLTPTLPPGVKATAIRAQMIACGSVANGAQLQNMRERPQGPCAALKEELFQIETERLEGKITDAEYAEHKGALEVLAEACISTRGFKK